MYSRLCQRRKCCSRAGPQRGSSHAYSPQRKESKETSSSLRISHCRVMMSFEQPPADEPARCLLTPPPQGRKAYGSRRRKDVSEPPLCTYAVLRFASSSVHRDRRRQRRNLCCGSLHTDGSKVPHRYPAGDQMLEDLWSQTVNCNVISSRALPPHIISVGIGENVTGKSVAMCCNSAVTDQAMKLK